jgi:hypothetical protein
MATATTQTDLINHVSEETALEPHEVQRVLELTAQGIQQAAEHHTEIRLMAGTEKSHVVSALLIALSAADRDGTVDAATLATLRAFRNLVAHGRAVDRLIDALVPEDIEVPTPSAVLQARRNADARRALLEEFGALRSHEVADLADSRAANRAALANRWRAENRVVAVPWRDELLYPGFQFNSEGRPHSAVGKSLDLLRSDPHTSAWQAALWFATPTSWLGGQRPVDLLGEDPDAVIQAAGREVSDIAG